MFAIADRTRHTIGAVRLPDEPGGLQALKRAVRPPQNRRLADVEYDRQNPAAHVHWSQNILAAGRIARLGGCRLPEPRNMGIHAAMNTRMRAIQPKKRPRHQDFGNSLVSEPLLRYPH